MRSIAASYWASRKNFAPLEQIPRSGCLWDDAEKRLGPCREVFTGPKPNSEGRLNVGFRFTPYAAEFANSMGCTIDGPSFSGLLIRVAIGHIRKGSAGQGCINSRRELTH